MVTRWAWVDGPILLLPIRPGRPQTLQQEIHLVGQDPQASLLSVLNASYLRPESGFSVSDVNFQGLEEPTTPH